MRTVIALGIVVASLAGTVALLMREGTQPWQLVAVGAAAGAMAGGVRWGRRGGGIGVAVGCVLGLLAPIIYVPFWVAFTLPPYPDFDL